MDFRSEQIDTLFNVILSLKSVDECYAFFEDLCTIKELKDMSQRFQAAIKLDEGINYLQIVKEAHLSTATISRVSRCLNYGAGGYRLALDRMKGKK
jgi:TrpR-related protein YerC/YecD